MESYAKYADVPRVPTCLLIDEAPVVVLGRTFAEIVLTVLSFLGLAYFGMPFVGLLAAFVLGGLIPLLRLRFPRGFLVHLGWSLGLLFPEVSMFTLSRKMCVLGP